MPVLLALAGFVVFLCVFGLRGLMIAGAMVLVVFGVFGWTEHVDTVRRHQGDAQIAAECRAPGPKNEVDAFLCGK